MAEITAKLKALYIIRILEEQTDDTHSLTLQEIIDRLEGFGIAAERKSVYNDIEQLKLYGYDILREHRNRNYYYHIGSRRFELAELKLLADCVQAARFITEKKSKSLIGKIEGLASRYEAAQLQRQVFVAERVKSANEQILYNIDALHNAINSDSAIRFRYFRWNEKGRQEFRRDGGFYEVSPWALTLSDENYYLVVYDPSAEMIKYFRVDKMTDIELTGVRREGKKQFDRFDIASYTKKRFGMFDGEERRVKLLCENSFASIIIDRFGGNVSLHREDDTHFTVNVDVAVSRQFLGWLFTMSEGIKAVSPQDVVEEMKKMSADVVSLYGGRDT